MSLWFLSSPLEQFKIHSLFAFQTSILDLSITNGSLTLLAYMAFIFFLAFLLSKNDKASFLDKSWYFLWSELYKLVLKSTIDNAGSKGLSYFSILLLVFMTILMLNLFGMVPYSFTITARASFTFSISLSIWLGTVLLGFSNHGLNFFSMFLPKNVPLALAIPLIFIELTSFMVSPLSLGISLAANLTAGHLLLALGGAFLYFIINSSFFFLSWAPFILLIIFTFLELAVAFIQAYVFTLLSIGYMNDSLNLH